MERKLKYWVLATPQFPETLFEESLLAATKPIVELHQPNLNHQEGLLWATSGKDFN